MELFVYETSRFPCYYNQQTTDDWGPLLFALSLDLIPLIEFILGFNLAANPGLDSIVYSYSKCLSDYVISSGL